MKTSELREMSDEQLQVTLKDASTTLFRLKIKSQTERLDVPSELAKNRRLIARIKTVQSERRRQAETGGVSAE
ncbi:MAG: 50S ribosomal protein L29 [Planctomycetota bacterium]|jgi:large subunit ribosomal protein L29|nr:50S ribosomal protein L29 [Pirellulaceae bacterium]MEC7110049.1 50S ribosomal protein L29 [Planctomycetota bacterium]MDP7377362.1 50S ribosomal protein L29 [Pirellulaceae bacterium]MEC7354893.1 50S ribosomal protein L29 [Planctomycetota bacterium]MEC7428782.1 50S ribosomal protein L29 [Planctomycetota bacterium]